MMIFVPDVKVGDKFGRLTFQRLGERSANSRQWSWICLCDCGKEVNALGSNIRSGRTKSCGCWQKEATSKALTKHGKSSDPLYGIWKNMKQRCYNPTHHRFRDYGGRGILMHDAWKDDFAAFSAGIGERPSQNHSIDRIDNNNGYIPGNIRWVPQEAQNLNRRNTVLIQDGEDRVPMKIWCQNHGLSYFRVYDLIVRRKMQVSDVKKLLIK